MLSLTRFFRRNIRISPDQDLQYKQWVIPKNVSLPTFHTCPKLSALQSAKKHH